MCTLCVQSQYFSEVHFEVTYLQSCELGPCLPGFQEVVEETSRLEAGSSNSARLVKKRDWTSTSGNRDSYSRLMLVT